MVENKSGGAASGKILLPRLAIESVQSDGEEAVASVVSSREKLNETIIENEL